MLNGTDKMLKNDINRIKLLEILAKAEDDVIAGKIAPITDTFSELREALKIRQI